jgi:hypothetical protein
MRHNYAEAETRYRESLRAAIPLGDVVETSFEVEGVAMAAGGKGDAKRAALLAAAVEALHESLGIVVEIAFWNELLEEHIGSARERLGTEEDAVWDEGRKLAFDDAVGLALTLAD